MDLDSFYTILVQTNFIHNINPSAFWGSSKGLMSCINHSKGISLLGALHYFAFMSDNEMMERMM